MKRCPKCQTILDDQAVFCHQCGGSLPAQDPKQAEHAAAIGQIWPEWRVERLLGKGSYGVVYSAIREEGGLKSHTAIKVITVPNDPGEVKSLRAEGLDLQNTRAYFQKIVDDFTGEVRLMDSLKGVQNIVSVEDYKVVAHPDKVQWDIFIRMELLIPFDDYLVDHPMSEQDVIRLGCDICSALELCEQRNIIHRDIKPENIFVNSFGHFKLGDFGIARKLENQTSGLSQKGTFNYMAPEVAHSNHYDNRVDIYSLGIVLYRLLNHNNLPFLNDNNRLNPHERRAAVDRRLAGERLPLPCGASAQVAQVILKACAFDPAQRFANATALKTALQQAANGTYLTGNPDLDQTVAVSPAPNGAGFGATHSHTTNGGTPGGGNIPHIYNQQTPPTKKKKSTGLVALILAVVILLTGGIGFAVYKVMEESEDSYTALTFDHEDSSQPEESQEYDGYFEDDSYSSYTYSYPTSSQNSGSSAPVSSAPTGSNEQYSYTKGSINSNGYYVNPWADMYYNTNPFTVASQSELNSLSSSNTDFVLVVTDSNRQNLRLGFEYLQGYTLTADDYLDIVESSLDSQYKTIDPNHSLKVLGHSYTTIGGITYRTMKMGGKVNGVQLYQHLHVRQLDGYMIVIAVTAQNESGLDMLVSYFE